MPRGPSPVDLAAAAVDVLFEAAQAIGRITRSAKQKGAGGGALLLCTTTKPLLLHRSAYRQTSLDYSEIHPLAVDGLQLVHAPIVGVEEVAAIRNRMVVRSADRTTGPTAAARSSPAAAVFAGFFAEFDAVLNLVFDASKTCWN
jgi:hypothetical protein